MAWGGLNECPRPIARVEVFPVLDSDDEEEDEDEEDDYDDFLED